MATDFAIAAGDTKTLEVTVTDGSGTAVDLTGATIRWHMARSVNATALVEKSTASGITITSAAGGTFDVALVAADTEALRGSFYHEAEVVDDDGNVSTVLTGTVTVTPTLIDPEA